MTASALLGVGEEDLPPGDAVVFEELVDGALLFVEADADNGELRLLVGVGDLFQDRHVAAEGFRAGGPEDHKHGMSGELVHAEEATVDGRSGELQWFAFQFESAEDAGDLGGKDAAGELLFDLEVALSGFVGESVLLALASGGDQADGGPAFLLRESPGEVLRLLRVLSDQVPVLRTVPGRHQLGKLDDFVCRFDGSERRRVPLEQGVRVLAQQLRLLGDAQERQLKASIRQVVDGVVEDLFLLGILVNLDDRHTGEFDDAIEAFLLFGDDFVLSGVATGGFDALSVLVADFDDGIGNRSESGDFGDQRGGSFWFGLAVGGAELNAGGRRSGGGRGGVGRGRGGRRAGAAAGKQQDRQEHAGRCEADPRIVAAAELRGHEADLAVFPATHLSSILCEWSVESRIRHRPRVAVRWSEGPRTACRRDRAIRGVAPKGGNVRRGGLPEPRFGRGVVRDRQNLPQEEIGLRVRRGRMVLIAGGVNFGGNGAWGDGCRVVRGPVTQKRQGTTMQPRTTMRQGEAHDLRTRAWLCTPPLKVANYQ